jgi:hypothetical protein
MQRHLEHTVSDNLERLLADLADHQCAFADATRQIRTLLVEAREEYRAKDGPYGDDRGLCRSLLAKPRLTPTA